LVGDWARYRVMRILSLGRLAFLTFTILSVSPSGARDIVHFSGYSVGTIVVKTNERRLYYVIGEGEAIRYPVGVGRVGTGLDQKRLFPAAGGNTERQPCESDGCGGLNSERGRRICHPWHK
jgi:hypothetical protein